MQINHVRCRTVTLPRSFAVVPVSCFRHQTDTDHSAKKIRGGEFRDCTHFFLVFFFVFRPEAAGDERPYRP
jgi:hypothetical protein